MMSVLKAKSIWIFRYYNGPEYSYVAIGTELKFNAIAIELCIHSYIFYT